jgi:hypothetical protein
MGAILYSFSEYFDYKTLPCGASKVFIYYIIKITNNKRPRFDSIKDGN